MLVGFSFKNFRNFKEEQTLSLRAKPAAKERLTWNAFKTGRKDVPHILKAAAIYGANPDFGSFQVLKIVGCPAAHFFWLIFLILLYRLVIDAL